MDLKLRQKHVLVVGASKGIGRAIAGAFADEGTCLTLLARSAQLLEEVKQEALERGAAECNIFSADLMAENPAELAQKLLEQFGLFDIIVHNVGGSLVSRNHLGGEEEWLHALRFNALAAIDMNSKLIPPMLERHNGCIVHVSSISAHMLRGNPLYASAKAFLNAYVTTVGRQLAPEGVRLCSVMPGAVAFPGSYWDGFVKEKHPRVEDFLTHHQAIHRFGTPEEIANVVLFLASNKASFVLASNVPVDGGNM